MKNLFLLLCAYAISILASGQVNQLDSAGKKDGKWIEYLDLHWMEVKDSSQAAYFRYTYYDHGYNVFKSMKYYKEEHLEPSENSNNPSATKKCVVLNGEYKWYDQKNRLIAIEFYQNGEYTWCKSYDWGISGDEYKGKKLHEYFDYTKKFEHQPCSFYYESYDRHGVVTKWYMHKDGKSYKCFETRD